MNACILPVRAKQLKEDLLAGRINAEQILKLLPEEKVAVKAILEDIVAENLGIKVSPDEIANISRISEKIDTAQVKLGEELGNPAKLQENLDFWKAKREMEDYLASKNPAPVLRIATGTVGRGVMLASIKSPVLNIGSNIEIGFAEALSRRIANGQLRGADNGLAVDYVKMVNKIYQETGYDISRMTKISDTGSSGARVLGEDVVHAQGPGAYRKGARVVEDIVFKQLMGAPDVAFSSAHFADSVNLNSMKMAKGDKLIASGMMRDAMRLEPRSPEGEVLRAQAILDAQTATWTDKSWAASVTENLRGVFNKASGDARLGDILFPFIKTPANVIATGIDYAGGGIPKAMYEGYKAFRAKEFTKQTGQRIARNLVRAGLGIAGAVMIAMQLKDEDFMGAYDPARAQIEQLRNTNYNAFRIGNKWVSTDWLGPLAVPVTAMMYSRKYGQKGWKERVFQYWKGTGSAILNLPVISDIYDYVKSNAFKQNQSLDEMTGETLNYLTSQVYSRMVPSFMSDLANAIDSKQRQAGTGLQSIQAKIPFLRNKLPEKKNIFGDTVKGEPVWSDILFGSRIKTSQETSIISEINRISTSTDKGINFTNWDKSSGKILAQFKEKKGQQVFDEAKILYGQKLKQKLETELAKDSYRKLNDDEKLKLINGFDAEVTKEIYKKYGFTYIQVKDFSETKKMEELTAPEKKEYMPSKDRPLDLKAKLGTIDHPFNTEDTYDNRVRPLYKPRGNPLTEEEQTSAFKEAKARLAKQHIELKTKDQYYDDLEMVDKAVIKAFPNTRGAKEAQKRIDIQEFRRNTPFKFKGNKTLVETLIEREVMKKRRTPAENREIMRRINYVKQLRLLSTKGFVDSDKEKSFSSLLKALKEKKTYKVPNIKATFKNLGK